MLKKTIMCVSLMVCLVFAGTANAAPIDYVFTVDGDVVGGTFTFDSTVGSSNGDGAISAYSFYRAGSNPGTLYDQSDGGAVWIDSVDGAGVPLTLGMDIDDFDGDAYLYADPGFNFSTGAGFYEPGAVNVTGAKVEVVPEPATMSLLALGGLAMLRRRRRA